MRRKLFWACTLLALLCLVRARSLGAPAEPNEKVIYSFAGGPDGANPLSALTIGNDGNLYGTTSYGGTGCQNYGCGTVFRLVNQAGSWQRQTLYAFTDGSDGSYPVGGVIFDASGNLYGASNGGANYCGVIYKLTPTPSVPWKFQVLYTCPDDSMGTFPTDLVFDTQGNLFGTMEYGGDYERCFDFGCGAVFRVSPQPNGNWRGTILYEFKGYPEGGQPSSGLVFDSAGNLFGTTWYGGKNLCIGPYETYGCGVIYELMPQSDGTWAEKIIYNFAQGGGVRPSGGLVFDSAGNIFGNTQVGGDEFGVVFELSPSSTGEWQAQVLHNFFGPQLDGAQPVGKLINERDQNILGVTANGGGGGVNKYFGYGSIFRLTRTQFGWRVSLLHSFTGQPDGANPAAGLVSDSQGHYYGTTQFGGNSTLCSGGCGAVYVVTP